MIAKENFKDFFMAIPAPSVVLALRGSDFLIVAANDAYLKLTGTSRNEVQGKVMNSVYPIRFSSMSQAYSSVEESIAKVRESLLKHKTQEVRCTLPVAETGVMEERFLNIENTPIKDEEGRLSYILQTVQENPVKIRNVKKQVGQEQKELGQQEFSRSSSVDSPEEIVVEKKKFLQVNASFVNFLLQNDLEPEALQEAFGIIGKAVKVDRMYYFKASTDKNMETHISQKVEWSSEERYIQIDNPNMQHMPVNQVFEIMGPLVQNRPFTANLSELDDGELKSLFIEQDIKAMLLLPIFLKNRLYGFIGFDDCSRERFWTEEEISFLRSLTQNLTATLEKRSAEEALKQEQEKLRRSEEKFKALVEEGSELMAILDKEGNYKFISRTSTSILGFSPEEFKGQNGFESIHPDDRETAAREFSELLQNKKKRFSPYRVQNSEGNWRWIETAATNLLEDSIIGGIVINSRDITTVLEQAKEIEQINERYQLAANATQDLIYDWNLITDQVTRFSSGTNKLFGYSTEEVNTRSFWRTHIHPEDVDRLSKHLKATLKNPEILNIRTEYRFRRADGSFAQVIDRGNIIRNAEGKAIRLIGATNDISYLKEKEQELSVANERFSMALKATNEMVWDWNLATDQISRSKAFEKILGYDLDQEYPVDSFWFNKILQEDRERVRKSLRKAMLCVEQETWKEEYRIQKSNGEISHVTDSAYILRNSTGEAIRMVGAVLDVSESRGLLKEIWRQNRVLKEIAWEQSHVVRAPLARLKGLISFMELKSFEEMDQEELFKQISSSANELDDIIKRIVAKTEQVEKTSNSAPSLVNRNNPT